MLFYADFEILIKLEWLNMSDLFEVKVWALSRGRGPTGTGRPGVAQLPAAVALTGVVPLLLSGRRVVPPLNGTTAVPLPGSLSTLSFSRRLAE